jgi:hypothetical protein
VPQRRARADVRRGAGTRVEHVLLAVAAGVGLALLPETVTERFAAPGSASLPSRQAKPPSAARYRPIPMPTASRHTRSCARSPEPPGRARPTALERPSSWPHDPVGVVRRHQFPAGSPSQPHDEPSRSVGGGGLIRTLARLRADGRAARHLSLSRAQASTRPTSCPGGRTRPVWLDRFFFLWSMGAEAILGGSGVL